MPERVAEAAVAAAVVLVGDREDDGGACRLESLPQRVDVDVLWRGRAFQPSGTRGPDAIELELAGLPEGASREDVHRVLADQEAADREAMMATVRAELAGYGGEIQWHRLALPTGESRKDATCTLPVRVLVDRYTPKVVTDSSEGEEVKAEAGA